MIKSLRWPLWLLIMALFSGVLFLVNQLLSSGTYAEEKVERKDWSKYPGLALETRTKKTEYYTFSISLPMLDNKEMNKIIQKWAAEKKEFFLSKVEENKDQIHKDNPASLSIEVDTIQLDDEMYSLVFSSHLDSGGANGKQYKKTFNINVSTHDIIGLDDVIKDKESIEEMRKLVQNEMEKNKDLFAKVDKNLLEKSLANPQDWKWSMDSDQFHVYFDESEISKGDLGSVTVDISMDEVEPLLQLQTEGEQEKIIPLDPNGKYVALTFDDGPNKNVTPQVLQILKEFDAKATFFMLGIQVERYPELARKVANEGHEVANHGYDHHDLTQLNKQQIKSQIVKTKELIKEVTGQVPSLLRPPYGAFDHKVEAIASLTSSPLVLWSVDSLDWKRKGSQTVSNIVQQETNPNSIILLHDIHSTSAEALPTILSKLKEDGYQFVTVSQLLTLEEFDMDNPVYGAVR
ncbi:polysaccharide deacetylase family protein [Bacillus spongiae]|uniref:Polysaccharide deacetylase family protein n=1 Tax=Bacillus spongiae TaxID=2683610 RepID=A0ABU8HEM6_9BACI